MSGEATADWDLRVTLLGIGGAFHADQGIANTAALLELREGPRVVARYLLDCGHTTGRQLHALGLSYDDIDGVLITHAHGDHIDGLELYGYRSRFMCGRRGTLYCDASVLASTWASLRAKMGWLKTGPNEGRQACIDDYFCAEAVGAEGKTLAGGRLHVRFVALSHVPRDRAFGICVQLEPSRGRGPVLRWSGDTTFRPDGPLFEDLDPERGDLVFHDCSFDPYKGDTVHTHLEELRTLPEALRAGIVLVHHGQVREQPKRIDGMLLGQALQRFVLRP